MTATIVRFHFLFSVLAEIALGVLVVAEPTLLFAMDAYYPDPLRNNILIIAGYLALLELLLLATRYPGGGYLEALLTGLLFLLVAVGIPVYASLNHIDMRPEIVYFSAYFTISHILYFLTRPASVEH